MISLVEFQTVFCPLLDLPNFFECELQVINKKTSHISVLFVHSFYFLRINNAKKLEFPGSFLCNSFLEGQKKRIPFLWTLNNKTRIHMHKISQNQTKIKKL